MILSTSMVSRSCESPNHSCFLYANVDDFEVVAINADNASNNNTMVKHLETLLQRQDFVEFNPSEVRMWCMPHTVHLAAMEVLECISELYL
jgi:hypothetical protein